jgi:F0F1-type ATP synthase membrane subunit b/b'
MVQLFDAREKAIGGAREDAKAMQKEASLKADDYERQMESVRAEAQKERDRLRAEGAHLERTILDRVRIETDKTLSDAEAQLDLEGTRIRREIQKSTAQLANQAASRLLGREITS